MPTSCSKSSLSGITLIATRFLRYLAFHTVPKRPRPSWSANSISSNATNLLPSLSTSSGTYRNAVELPSVMVSTSLCTLVQSSFADRPKDPSAPASSDTSGSVSLLASSVSGRASASSTPVPVDRRTAAAVAPSGTVFPSGLVVTVTATGARGRTTTAAPTCSGTADIFLMDTEAVATVSSACRCPPKSTRPCFGDVSLMPNSDEPTMPEYNPARI
mmetsp:Transcript_15538/g.48629  ORF Transcript_15538/g.48629 Transcript_15538/m.48629 type:complete len:216 (-) Transcript_15538:639-1286(-)